MLALPHVWMHVIIDCWLIVKNIVQDDTVVSRGDQTLSTWFIVQPSYVGFFSVYFSNCFSFVLQLLET